MAKDIKKLQALLDEYKKICPPAKMSEGGEAKEPSLTDDFVKGFKDFMYGKSEEAKPTEEQERQNRYNRTREQNQANMGYTDGGKVKSQDEIDKQLAAEQDQEDEDRRQKEIDDLNDESDDTEKDVASKDDEDSDVVSVPEDKKVERVEGDDQVVAPNMGPYRDEKGDFSTDKEEANAQPDIRNLDGMTLDKKELLAQNSPGTDQAAGLSTNTDISKALESMKTQSQPHSGQSLADAQKQRDQNILSQSIMKNAALAASGFSKTDPSQALKLIGENDKYVGMPIQKYEETLQNQQFDPNSQMSTITRDYLTSKGLKVPDSASAADLFKIAPFLQKDSALNAAYQKMMYQQSQMNERSKQSVEARSKEASLNRENSTKNAQIRADAIKSGQGKADSRQDQRLAGQIVQRIHMDPIIKPSMQNMASLEKSKMILENQAVPLTPQLLADAEQDIASALTIRGMGGTEGKIKRSELITLDRQFAQAKQKYLNQPDIDLRKEDPDLVKQIYKTNRALYEDYDQSIKDAKDTIAKEYQPMAENSPRLQKTVNQYLKQTTAPSPEDAQALDHFNSLPNTDPNKAILGNILKGKGIL